ncbi:site-specific DNA-methyltransferase [Microbacterium profundi]|uniref:site-specific DNA-methyltransferase n=1 Tax=Microbacterium profundi TaxID=450380 RepID=UPI001F1605FC|nr:DNA methyltransferase [Microbacterium profundi]MCE7483405.1 site-specific DNA-methyltransferase [Microbacterium profundi]
MSRLTDLLRQVRGTDAQLGADLEKEISALTKRRSFGLVFERHQPEAVELPGQPIRRGAKVRVLQPRGETAKGDSRLWRVDSIETDFAGQQIAQLIELVKDAPEHTTAPIEDLVVVAEFDDKIYPGLVETGRVERGGDKPFHTVINAENFHALEMLTYTHRGRVDAIYIDPPYNSGAQDWKYNNDYVEGDDDYRHSKWLSFMERRLLVARELLRRDGALVVTIDEHEVNRLGVLLDQVFPESTRQLVTIVNNPKGVTQSYLSRVEEYAFFVFGPEARLGSVDDDLLTHRDVDGSDASGEIQRPRWKGLLRSGDDSLRADRKDMFYPVWLDVSTGKLVQAGAPLPWGDSPSFEEQDGLTPIWPIRRDLQEGRWGVGPATLNSLIEQGFAAAGKFDKKRNTWAVSYLSRQVRDDLDLGLLEVRKRDTSTGVADVVYVDTAARRVRTVWHRSSHDAGAHGTDLIRGLLGQGRTFPFPKSLYAVEDSVRPLVANKPDAIILDFFSGSGTTAHAVMRLNHQDRGRRQCISVTNNEVSAGEHSKLRKQRLRPGDSEWERWGICDYITKPRIRAAITGKTPDGEPIKGEYKFTDEFPMAEGFEENAAFFTLTYEAPLSVRHNRAFERVAPMLWLRAGATGRVIDDLGDRGWDVSAVYGVLENIDDAEHFFEAVRGSEAVHAVFVVTDDDAAFQMVCRELASNLNVVRLYESYLQNFEINQGRGF